MVKVEDNKRRARAVEKAKKRKEVFEDGVNKYIEDVRRELKNGGKNIKSKKMVFHQADEFASPAFK